MLQTTLITTLLTLLALPALAVTPQAGNIVVLGLDESVVVIDHNTQARTVVSCWGTCSPALGAGPEPDISGDLLVVGPFGGVYFRGAENPNIIAVYRVDLGTGDRTSVSGNLDDPDDKLDFGTFVVWPAPSFFPPTVASLGGWGLAMLVVGVLIGLQLRVRVLKRK